MLPKILNVSIELENDAFERPNGSLDLDAIRAVLYGAADQIYSGRIAGPIQDINGNTVGSYDLGGT